MASFSLTNSSSPCHFLSLQSLLIVFIVFSYTQHISLAQQLPTDKEGGIVGVRRLLGFKETPAGGNFTFDCSPSGPCVPCQYSEKSDDKYRCSETGYRIPFKCVKTGDSTEDTGGKKPQNSRSTLEGFSPNVKHSAVKHRTLADDASDQEGEPQAYVTYRSCIQAADEEKLSILGFEVLMLGLLLISGSLVFFRRKQTIATAGVRIQTNSRF